VAGDGGDDDPVTNKIVSNPIANLSPDCLR
jgi:hypothetical protein